ncbi:MAG: hypothetical protein FJZ01_11680 [Candidatus Sericytochromatia bacterium]|nr:hypothetical protein [Candidatus Tanganyikabacteria bacterium]
MDYRGVVIEHDLVGVGWSFFDPVNRVRVCANQLEILYWEIDHLIDTPDGAD